MHRLFTIEQSNRIWISEEVFELKVSFWVAQKLFVSCPESLHPVLASTISLLNEYKNAVFKDC